MEPNHTYYPIDTSDIWPYMREKVIFGQYSDQAAKFLIEKIQPIIIANCEPVFGKEIYNMGSESDKAYYSLQIKKYIEAINNITENFRLDYFFNLQKCYQYDDEIIIEKDHIDFDYWFVLKLGQYDTKINEIPNFLQYHLTTSYSGHFDEFNDFLKFAIKQYTTEYLSDRVISTVNDWLSDSKLTNETIKQNKLINRNTNTFQLIDPTVLGENSAKLLFAFKQLKNENFIDELTPFENFRSIFAGKSIRTKNKVLWLGTNLELKVFIQELINLKKVINPKNEIWEVTINCFVKKGNKEFQNNQFRNTGGIPKKLEKISFIVSKF